MCYVHVRVHVHVRVRVRVRVRVQHLRELRASEGRVPRVAVERADAFLQAEQALVNLRPLEARRAVLGRGVRRTLRPSQVYQAEPAQYAAYHPSRAGLDHLDQRDLQDGVRDEGRLGFG